MRNKPLVVLTWIQGAGLFLILELLYRYPARILLLGLLAGGLSLVTVLPLLGKGLKTPWTRVFCLAIPLLFSWSALAFALLVEESWLRHILALAVSGGMMLFLESLRTYIWEHETYQSFSLENLAGYALILTTFFSSAALLGISRFLDFSPAGALPLALLIFYLINASFFWVSRLPLEQTSFPLILLTLFQLELLLVLFILPWHFMVAGAILTVAWYGLSIMIRAALLDLSNRRSLTYQFALTMLLILMLVIYSLPTLL